MYCILTKYIYMVCVCIYVLATAAVPGIPMAAYGHGTLAAIPVASIPASAAYPQARSYR